MLPLIDDNPTRAHQKDGLCKALRLLPLYSYSGKPHRCRLSCGDNLQANAVLYRVAIVSMRGNEPTITYGTNRTIGGKSIGKNIRCQKH